MGSQLSTAQGRTSLQGLQIIPCSEYLGLTNSSMPCWLAAARPAHQPLPGSRQTIKSE